MQMSSDSAVEAGMKLPERSPQQIAAETNANLRSFRRSRRVRIIVAILIIAFVISGIGNLVVTICSSFMVIPYWNVKPIKSALEISLVVVPRMVMLLTSLFCVIMFTVSMLWYKEEPTLHLPDFMEPVNYPSVDIFLPRYKEEWDLYEPTVQAALALDYPKDRIVVHVLDDGSRSAPLRAQLEPLMKEHSNLRYVTRPDGTDAKATNLKNMLFQMNNALIVVFDADHRCKPDFLLRTIPHLFVVDGHRVGSLSSQTAFVQTTPTPHLVADQRKTTRL